MPIHFNDLDVVSKVAGVSSALIVPCNMCPAATVAVRENKPFMQFFRSFLKVICQRLLLAFIKGITIRLKMH